MNTIVLGFKNIMIITDWIISIGFKIIFETILVLLVLLILKVSDLLQGEFVHSLFVGGIRPVYNHLSWVS